MRRAVPPLAPLVPSQVGLRRLITLEAATAAAVVLAAAFMSASPPARGPRFDPVAVGVVQPPAASRVGDLIVTLAVRPDRPGPNFLDIGVLDTRRPAPAPIGSVTVRLVEPAGAGQLIETARPIAAGKYEVAGLSLAEAASWVMTVEVDREGLAPVTVDFPWTVQPPLAVPHTVVVSDAPLGQVATPLALVLGLFLLALGILVTVRRGARLRVPSVVPTADPTLHQGDMP